jgi:hypothetical protein
MVKTVQLYRLGRYYDVTPGHNLYLINHKIEPSEAAVPSGLDNEDEVFSRNLEGKNPMDTFYTRLPDRTVKAWRIRDLSDNGGTALEVNARKAYASNYWVATVPVEIIKDHNDIWSEPAMEMLAGVYRISEQLSKLPPPSNIAVKPGG